MNQATRAFDHAIPANDEGTVNGRKFLYRLIHEGIEDIPIDRVVTMKRIEHERFHHCVDLARIADNEETANRFSLAAL